MNLVRGLCLAVLSVSIILGAGATALADDMGGMNMGGMNMGAQNQSAAGSMQNGQSGNMPGMDPNMPGMNSGMTGSNSGEPVQGANPAVVGGFAAVNLLVVAAAGVLKYKSKAPV